METSLLLSDSLISFSVVGNGPEHVLFLAGMCMTREAWHPQVDFFARNPQYTLLLPDNRGVGLSERPADGYNLDSMADDAWAVVDAVAGKMGTVHIVGHSMGSMIAARAALRAPHRTQSLALLSGHAGGWWWSNVPSPGLTAAAIKLGLQGHSAVAMAEVGVSLHYSDAYLDELVVDNMSGAKMKRRDNVLKRYMNGALVEADEDPSGSVFWGQLEAIRQYQISPVECETLKTAPFRIVAIFGNEDPVIIPSASRELAEKTGAASFCVPGKHFIADESSHDVNAILLALFRLGSDAQEQHPPELPFKTLKVLDAPTLRTLV